MSKLIWDAIGERLYETGVSQGVLYPQNGGIYPLGVAWNGLTNVTESPSGAEPTPLYADNIKYLNLMSVEEFGATIEAYTYPEEFALCDGSADLSTGVSVGQQKRKSFGLAYKTVLGNDTEAESYGYKLHLVYGALAAPSEKGYASINETPEAIAFSWELTTTPVAVTNLKPTASVVIDSTKVDAAKLLIIENILFGTESSDPRLPLPDEIKSIFDSAAPSAIALSSSVPIEGATGVAVDANIVLTFNNKINKESVIVSDEDGVIIAGSKSFDGTGKILTFHPTANLSATTKYYVTVIGVSDIYGQSLATVIRSFTTV